MSFQHEIYSPGVKVLDHGFIRLVDTMGNDDAIVDAARVSFGSTAAMHSKAQNRGLIRYMMRHRHTTPFEMCEIKIHVKLPILVARQWIRHRTANVNEYSGRYREILNEFYVPEPEQICYQSDSNRQGRGDAFENDMAVELADKIRAANHESLSEYHYLLDQGMALETARGVTSVSQYTEWYWKCDLHNVLGFLSQRMDGHAQYEIRVYANHLAEIVKAWVPVAWEAFEDYRLGAHTFSRQEMEILRALVESAPGYTGTVDARSQLTEREWKAFLQALGRRG
ncbi:MAG: FAD-dependent thymidylate synthase [Hyphomicrobium sp.]|nr:FAD-dependent thymidylate synthase [Hyphomicrobium sp.]